MYSNKKTSIYVFIKLTITQLIYIIFRFITRNRFVPPVDTKPPRKLYPCFDSSEMYYGLDFSDSQSSPLIQ